jgi:hypothetical protein
MKRFEVLETQSMVEGNNYIVYHDFEFNGDEGIFILHMQGKRPLFNMMKQLDEQYKSYYFCEGLEGVWKNHRELVGHFDNGLQIFRFIK